jgi:integration host factor subunit alpha
MNLTKADLIESVKNQSGFLKAEAALIVESVLKIIKKTLESGEDVLISGFGKFCVKDKKEQRGRNPQTADDMQLRAKKVVTFRWSGVLKERMNGRKRS